MELGFMIKEPSKEQLAFFSELLTTMKLKNIEFMEITSRKMAIGISPDPAHGDFKFNWNQVFADGDPVFQEDDLICFRPKYEFVLTQNETDIFTASLIVVIQFSLLNKNHFNELWKDEICRQIFLDKQIVRTMWTILRQQIMDCMTRHALHPIPLPWIL
jgi:hypothetical protein